MQKLKDDLETRTLLRCDRGATLLCPSSSSFLDEDSLVAFENIYLFSFVETPRKFIIAELSIRKLGSSSVLIIRLFEFTRPFL